MLKDVAKEKKEEEGNFENPRISLSIHEKFLLFWCFIALTFFLTVAYELYTLSRVSNLFRSVTEYEIFIAQGIEEALVSVLESKSALELAVLPDQFSELETIQKEEARLHA